jgi:antitoxin component YwqK of YwqJK toxin-antitoxin module
MRLYPLFIFFLTSFSCTTKQNHFDTDKWYEQTKNKILEMCNITPDSTFKEYYDDGKVHVIKSFKNGHLISEKLFRGTGEQVTETNYSSDEAFQLRKEICEDGQISFEGIFYKGEAYGLSRWWRCDQSKIEEGVRFRSDKIGIWKKWNKDGQVTESNYRHENFLDSLRLISL